MFRFVGNPEDRFSREEAHVMMLSLQHDIQSQMYNLSDSIWAFLPPYMGVIPNPKMTFIFPISYILVLIFPIFIIYFPKCEGKGSFPKSEIKSQKFTLSNQMSDYICKCIKSVYLKFNFLISQPKHMMWVLKTPV